MPSAGCSPSHLRGDRRPAVLDDAQCSRPQWERPQRSEGAHGVWHVPVRRRASVSDIADSSSIRKVKCDEGKPRCRRCVATGRTCDGYTAPFRATQTGGRHLSPSSTEIDPREIEILARDFSTKTIFHVRLGCEAEARQVLEASRTDAPVRAAVASLRALRADYELTRGQPLSEAHQTPAYRDGIEQYTRALGGLAAHLSTPSTPALRSALLCCQIFMSIEQVNENHDTLVQHLVRGLTILREARARPQLTVTDVLMPARHQLPFLDAFVVKMFAAPCKFEQSFPAAHTPSPASSRSPESFVSASTSPTTPASSALDQPSVESPDRRAIAPNMRTALIRVSASTLQFLDHVAAVASVAVARQLRSERAALLVALDRWLVDFEHTQKTSQSPESIPVAFLRLFHGVLRAVILGALDAAPAVDAALRTEYDRIQSIARGVSEQLRARRMRRDERRADLSGSPRGSHGAVPVLGGSRAPHLF